MTGKNFLVFDFGASNGRAMVASFDGKKVVMDVTHRFENKPVWMTGTLYWDILHVFSELISGLQISLARYPDISSMAIDTWGCDFGFIDTQGKLVANPVTYREKKRHERAKYLYEILPERELFELSAGNINTIMGIYQLFSFQHEKALEMRCGDTLLMIPDLLNYFLTGRPCNEYTNATMMLVCDQYRKTWEKRILDRIGVSPSILSQIIMPGDTIGQIQAAICEETGITPLPVIASATHDTASAVTGIPIVEKGKHWAFISMGTWSIMGMQTDEPAVSDAVFESGYGNNALPFGKNMMVTYITGLWIIQQCRNRWVNERGASVSWEEIVNASVETGLCGIFVDVDDPVFTQPHANMPETVRTACRRSGQKTPLSMGDIARCLYESLVLKYRLNVERMERISGKPFDRIHIVGGGTKNHTLCQWIADATGVPVAAGPTETTSVGNVLMQLQACGEIHTMQEGREISLRSSIIDHYEPASTRYWDDMYPRYKEFMEKKR